MLVIKTWLTCDNQQVLAAGPCSTAADEADGAEEARFCVVHLQGKKLTSKREHQVCERAEAGIVHLRPVQSQTVGEGHSVLFWGVTCADSQHLQKDHEKCIFK